MPAWPWLALAGLGAFHGLNPAMGWLFAVALGLQRKSRAAVLWSLLPIAAGHALSIALVVIAVGLLRAVVDLKVLQIASALLLIGFGLYRLLARHRARIGMQVSGRDLTVWSFLMATAHGAGLMVLPFLVGRSHVGNSPGMSGMHAMHIAQASVVPLSGPVAIGLWATALHSAGYLLVTGLIAVIVYRKLGLRMLRTMWINLDLIWGGALVVTGGVALCLG